MILGKRMKVPGMLDRNCFTNNPRIADIKFKPGDILKFKCLITEDEFFAVVMGESDIMIELGLAICIVFDTEIQARIDKGECDHDFTDGKSPVDISKLTQYYHHAKKHGVSYRDEMKLIDNIWDNDDEDYY